MKGLVVERARPSNAIDVFPLIKQAAEAGVFHDARPTEKMLKSFYFKLLTEQLPSEFHFYYLGRRSRGYLGLLHAFVVPGRWDGRIDTMYIDLLFTVEKRRKMGVGQKLLDQLLADAENLGIKNFEFLVPDDQVEYWKKKRQAKKASNLMRVSL